MEYPTKRIYGDFLTPVSIVEKYILPSIESILYDYIWVDMFAGEGNLILPILNKIKPDWYSNRNPAGY